eukprot:jgi/Botrbrau1/7310/Bobra.247_3s0005.1
MPMLGSMPRLIIVPEVPAETTGAITKSWRPDKLILPCPRTGARAAYFLDGGRLLEANWFKQEHSCILHGDNVISDAGLHLYTPVDPIFIALPILEANRGQKKGSDGAFRNAEEAMHTDDFPDFGRVAPLALPYLACVCDVKDAAGDTYYRLNNDKVLAWLRIKVDRTCKGLCAACGPSFEDMEALSRTAYSAGILGEYLSPSWLALLRDSLGIQSDDSETGPPQGEPLQPLNGTSPDRPSKRQKVDPKEAAKKKAAQARAEARAAEMARDAIGTRSITSFFARPKRASAPGR